MTYYRDSAASRKAGIAYHLVPEAVWDAQRAHEWYTPETYAEDGFIHCTNGLDRLLTVANMFYVADARAFRVLVLDLKAIRLKVRYDDEGRLFPHIYGPLNSEAVIGELTVTRADGGTFVAIDE